MQSESMKIFYRDAAELVPYARNAKKHPDSQVRNIAKSLKRYGWRSPVLIHSGTGEIIAGHGRVLAAQLARAECPNLGQVPCIDGSDLTEAQIREYRILDNKLNESEWDAEILAMELPELELDDFEFDFYDDDEISEEGFGTSFELPDGDKSEFCQMTFTFHEAQRDIVKGALDMVGDCSETYGNTNKNGNALFEVVRQWVEQKKSL